MGVQGLTQFLKSRGIFAPIEKTGTKKKSKNRDNDIAQKIYLPSNSTLAIDGCGLDFHIRKIAYESFVKCSNENSTNPDDIILPFLMPYATIESSVNTFMSILVTKSKLKKINIYFDGVDDVTTLRMKAGTKKKRRKQREDQFNNLQQFCDNDVLPIGCYSNNSLRRPVDKRQCKFRNPNTKKGNNKGDVATNCLNSFPNGWLVSHQFRASLKQWEESYPNLVEIIDCIGEADRVIALASVSDRTGKTFALGNDSDYLIYGSLDFNNEEVGIDEMTKGRGEVLYVPLESLEFSPKGSIKGRVLKRNEIAEAFEMPTATLMVELSILLGNDYTGCYLRDGRKETRKRFRKSLVWNICNDTNNICIPFNNNDQYEEVPTKNLSDPNSVIELINSMGPHLRVSSTDPRLEKAIQFSRSLYGFEDTSAFTLESTTTLDCEKNMTRSLIPLLDLDFLKAVNISNMSIQEATIILFKLCLEKVPTLRNDINISNNICSIADENIYLEALRLVFTNLSPSGEENRPPNPPSTPYNLCWRNVQMSFVIDKCVSVAFKSLHQHLERENLQPLHLFDHALFHHSIETLSSENLSHENFITQIMEELKLEDDSDGKDPAVSNATTEIQAVDKDTTLSTQKLLPIDEYEMEILRSVKEQRVTIIEGETGCGKSSRVPVMLLRAPAPEPTSKAPKVKMFISQPRRIAAKGLTERIRSTEPDLRNKIALRMGHGFREYENESTCAWFVTTGYIVRLLANNPNYFDSFTHIIIDEVHERSVETDILCLLCRRLLDTHLTLKLVLMSATMAASLYTSYFGTPEPPIHVSARCFPIQEYFVEDLANLFQMPPKESKIATEVFGKCEQMKCKVTPSSQDMENLYKLATHITLCAGEHGSSVLIFCGGMSDIEAITEKIENLSVYGVKYTCIPIHGDVPFEDQMSAFEPPGPGEVKVVIATNAAESSVTLPDVDHVICLGLCKQIVYNPCSHRQMLQPCWISKASATQRAGRTGRVRKGNVYYLYSRNTYEVYMDKFESGEITRIPLDSVILSLRDMLKERVTPILEQCLEPPDISNIERSFKSLHSSNFITQPNDETCEITSLGSLVIALGIDLTLGSFIGLSIQFGVAAEAIQMSACLSIPKPPWMITNPLFHEIDQYNDISSKTFISRCNFDANLYSEPMSIMNLLWDYQHASKKDNFCWRYSVSSPRMRRLSSTADNLRDRVADCLNIPRNSLRVEDPPRRMAHAKLTILRVIQVWVFFDTMIKSKQAKNLPNFIEAFPLTVAGDVITKKHLTKVLHPERHPFELKNLCKVSHHGIDVSPNGIGSSQKEFFQGFETRYVSYSLEYSFSIIIYYDASSFNLITTDSLWHDSPSLQESIRSLKLFNDLKGERLTFVSTIGGNKRGVKGRACGAWVRYEGTDYVSRAEDEVKNMVRLSCKIKKKVNASKARKELEAIFFDRKYSFMSCINNLGKSRETQIKINSTIVSVKQDNAEISKTDFYDLFSSSGFNYTVQTYELPQVIEFKRCPSAPLICPREETTWKNSNKSSKSTDISSVQRHEIQADSSWTRPLLKDIPEGARLFSVLASGRRNGNCIFLPDNQPNKVEEEPSFASIQINKEIILSRRWLRKDTEKMVYLSENSVPAAAFSTEGSLELFACCANTLDLRGGGIRVQGISLLPPGRLFISLSFITFGLNPITSSPLGKFKEYSNLSNEKKEIIDWIQKDGNNFTKSKINNHITLAINFHDSCQKLGEKLVCYPDMVGTLCKVFDGVDGFDVIPWDIIEIEPINNKGNYKRRVH